MLTALLTAALQAASPSAPPPASDESIVVTGERPMTRGDIRHHLVEIGRTEQGQLARFATPICPAVVGMPGPYVDVIVERLRETASGVGLKVADRPCVSNVTLIVVPDGAQFVDAVRSTLIFSGLDPWEVRRVKRERPASAWNRIQAVNEHFQAAGSGGSIRVYGTSLFKQPIQQVILEAFVLIDEKAVVGKSLVQLADYLAMRTLAETKPPREGGDATILSLFDPNAAAPPSQATALDHAYLGGLYASEALRTSGQQRSRITTLIGRTLSPSAETDDRAE
ncbi:hypothetical protein E2493_06120 [Sphingomonas parva]|uniref:DUF2927 domain-containing protein n=1 Tax=Sphingomonas parva TaxID=2555898 RepID=A0A4Y8ZWL7_9SPHN|nr:hypothetical protein [Sphingomonas parva]TFI59099.1 hypothetical protein E2493_06120 [Sphingomonas parva]